MWPDPTDPSAMRSSFDPMPVKIPIGEFDPGRDPYAALSLADPGMQGPRPGTGSALGAPGPLPNAGPSRVSIQDVIDPGGIQRTLDTFSRTANSLQPDYGIKQTATNLQKLLEAEAVKKKKLGGGAPKKSLVERVIDMLQGGALSPTDLQRMNSGVDSAADNYTAVKDFAKTNKRAPDLSNADDMALLKAGGYVAPQVGSQGSLISNAAVDTPAVGYSGPRTRLGMNAAAADAVGTLGITKGPLGKTWNPDITPGKPNIGRLVKGGTIGSGLVGLGVAGYNMYEGYKTEREAKAESDRLKAVKDASIGQKMSIYDRSRNAWTQHVMRGDNYKKSGDNLLRTLTRDFLNSGKLETLSPEEWKQVQSHWATFAKDKR